MGRVGLCRRLSLPLFRRGRKHTCLRPLVAGARWITRHARAFATASTHTPAQKQAFKLTFLDRLDRLDVEDSQRLFLMFIGGCTLAGAVYGAFDAGMDGCDFMETSSRCSGGATVGFFMSLLMPIYGPIALVALPSYASGKLVKYACKRAFSETREEHES